jgi:hypothetical protein
MLRRIGRGLSRPQSLIAIGVLVATMLPLSSDASAAPSSRSSSEVYGYTCCASSFGTGVYHPGEIITVDWIRVTNHSTQKASTTIILSVSASGPFATVADVKKAFAKAHPTYGRTNFQAAVVRLSDTTEANPVSKLRVPPKAGRGFYELTTVAQRGLNFSSGGAIIHVS